MKLFRNKKRVLVLGGGGARGLAGIGVLKVLEKHFGVGKIPFDMIIGTSIGSLIGAVYSLGMAPEELEKRATEFNWSTILDIGFHSTGLVKGDKFETIIKELVGKKGFEDMRIPFALTTTNIETGEKLIHNSGDLVKLIHASCSWPGIFSAVEYDGKMLVDGGLRNSVPTKAAEKAGATFILAVNPGFAVKGHRVNNVLQALVQSVQIMGDELNNYQASAADVVIKTHLYGIDQFDFDKGKEIIAEGEDAAERQIKKLKRKLCLYSICSFR